MNTITARIGGKTYTAAAITTADARETIRLMEELDAARRAAIALNASSDVAEIARAVHARLRCNERALALLCRVFGAGLTPDALEDHLTRRELDGLVAALSDAVGDIATAHAPAASSRSGAETASAAMDKLYHTLAIQLHWPVAQIDAADFESLLRFVFYRDPDVRIINGREYRRAVGVPNWL